MCKFISSFIVAGVLFSVGCETRVGGPKLDNTTGTYANNMEAQKLNYLNNPAPKDATNP